MNGNAKISRIFFWIPHSGRPGGRAEDAVWCALGRVADKYGILEDE